MTKLSIITICFNEKHIQDTCESVANQTNQDFEWIVIDGGSTDGTLEVLEKYKNRINIFVSEKDNGVYDAMNKGIKKASGEYLLFMNGGDYFYAPDVLEKVMPYLKKDIDLLYGDINLLLEGNKQKIKVMPDSLDFPYFFRDSIGHQATYTKKELFYKFGPYNTNYKIVSDWEKCIVFLKGGISSLHMPIVCANYRMDGISFTNQKLSLKEQQEVFKQYFSRKEIKKYQKKLVSQKSYYLFGVIPLYKIRKKENSSNHYLFGFIPFLKINK